MQHRLIKPKHFLENIFFSFKITSRIELYTIQVYILLCILIIVYTLHYLITTVLQTLLEIQSNLVLGHSCNPFVRALLIIFDSSC